VIEKYNPDHAHQNFVHITLYCVQASQTPQKFVLTACCAYYILYNSCSANLCRL